MTEEEQEIRKWLDSEFQSVSQETSDTRKSDEPHVSEMKDDNTTDDDNGSFFEASVPAPLFYTVLGIAVISLSSNFTIDQFFRMLGLFVFIFVLSIALTCYVMFTVSQKTFKKKFLLLKQKVNNKIDEALVNYT